MRILVASLTALFAVLLLAPAVTAWNDPFMPAEPVTDVVYPELDPVCAEILADARKDGTLGNHSDAPHEGWEKEPMEDAPACAELRDEIQWEYPAYDAVGEHYQCRAFFGKNCVATNHDACDLGLVVGSGLLYICMGGLTPRN